MSSLSLITRHNRAQSWLRFVGVSKGSVKRQRPASNEEDPGDRDQDDQRFLQDHHAEPVPQLSVLQAAAAVQVDHRVNAGRELGDG